MDHSRAKKIDIPPDVATKIFDENIVASRCVPESLWILNKVSSNSITSDWPKIAKNIQILISLLEASGGLIPKHASLRTSFCKWLAGNNYKWRYKDAEKNVYHLRVMIGTMHALKRDNKPVPKSFQQLQVLVDMIKIEDNTSVPATSAPAAPLLDQDRDPGDRDEPNDDEEVMETPIQPKSIPVVDLVSVPGLALVEHDLDTLSNALFKEELREPPSSSTSQSIPQTEKKMELLTAERLRD
eukprot:4570480-Pyramimonas_sp.AAC.1